MIDVTSKRVTTDDARAMVLAARETHGAAIDAFHRLWYATPCTWSYTFYEQRPILKCPMDLWTYQEIIADLKPTLIVETGTAYGASALYFAHQLDRLGQGAVISIDLDPFPSLPDHERLWFVKGSSIDPIVVNYVKERAKDQRVMVILDSDHSAAHVTAELEAYAPLVSPGQFLVVEDTNINGRPVDMAWKGGDGPGPALDRWLPNHPEFTADVLAERLLLSMMPGGWLKKANHA